MKDARSLWIQTALAFAFVLFFSLMAVGQQSTAVPALVKQPIDLQKLVTLQGNVHPLARPEYDQGLAPDSLLTERILLVLRRSTQQEAALRKLLDQQQFKASPSYHMWLTPEQFGEQFGPADADIQAVTDWLTSQGFEVSRVAAGRTVIEFSGTAGAVRQAFHTEIHKFAVEGGALGQRERPADSCGAQAGGGGLCLAEQLPQAADDPAPGRLFTVERHGRGEAALHRYFRQWDGLLCAGPDGFRHHLQCHAPLASHPTD